MPCRFAHTSILASLHDNPSALRKNVKRLGRGPGSGKGKTAGRGHKGQKARSGNGAPRGFEGGQTPISRLFPKRGFNNHGEEILSPLNLDSLQSWIKQGRIDPSKPITMKHILDSRVIHGIKDGVKLLARGKERFTSPITIDVTKASAEAIAAVEARGGTVTCTYRTRLSLRALLKPHLFDSGDGKGGGGTVSGYKRARRLPKDALPTRRKDVEYYVKKENRGYLYPRTLDGTLTVPMDPLERVRRKRPEVIQVSA